MADRTVTLALERLDRHMPFFLETVEPPPGVKIKAFEIAVGMTPGRRHGVDRHGRIYNDREFDVGEFSLASYIMAKARGEAFTATPVFPRRLFSQNHIFVNVGAGIRTPTDLIGKRVAIWSFQTTVCVLAKGDLKFDYGVPWDKIRWKRMHNEELPWAPPPELSIENLPVDKDPSDMLVEAEIDAMIYPLPSPRILARTDRVRRLFADAKTESIRHFDRHGFYPIMHLLVFPQEVVDRDPWLPRTMLDLYEQAKRQARAYYDDPGFSLVALMRNELEAQQERLGADLFPSGLAANRKNLEQFIGYCADQKLIERPIPVESLFDRSVLDS